MTDALGFARRVPLDFALLGGVGGIAAGVVWGGAVGVAFTAGCLWLALNFCLLAWLLIAISTAQRPPRWYLVLLTCAKIPMSYLILFGLFRLECLDQVGLCAGLISLPAVLVLRGLSAIRAGGRAHPQIKERIQD